MSDKAIAEAAYAEHYLPAPVDLIYLGVGVRARNIPGLVDLVRRHIIPLSEISPGADLAAAIDSVISGDPSNVTPIKIDAVGSDTVQLGAEGAASAPCECGGRVVPVIADLAIGPNLGLVLEGEDARFCFSCGWLRFPDDGKHLRRRLADWRDMSPQPDRVEPSLLYQSDAHPRSIQLEMTTRCNLTCGYCSHSLLEKNSDMNWTQFEQTIGKIDFSQVDIVDFTGLGEPTLNPLFDKMISEVARRGPHISIRVVSNAVAAGESRWRRLLDAGLSSVAFSIDTLNSERFAQQRGGASLAKALRTVAAVSDIRSSYPRHFSLRLKAVLLQNPYADAEALMRWSQSTGLDMPQFSTLDQRDAAAELYRGKDWLTHAFEHDAQADDFDRWSVRFWQSIGGDFFEDSASRRRYRHPHLLPKGEACRWVRDSTYITLGGDVLTCCESMIDSPRQIVGSITQASAAATWQGDLLWSYRLPVTIGKPPPGCVGCPQLPRIAA